MKTSKASNQSTSLSISQSFKQLSDSAPALNGYLILSGTYSQEAAKRPISQYFIAQGSDARALWADTAYSAWQEVMPYLVPINTLSPFWEWIDARDADQQHWGFALLSSASLDQLADHFKGLTQILMPSGEAVFFRYWDAAQSFSVLTHSNAVQRGQLMGPAQYWLHQQCISHPSEPEYRAREYPWWTLQESSEQALRQENPASIKENFLQRFAEQAPEQFAQHSETQLSDRLDIYLKQHPQARYLELSQFINKWER